ncbi:MULTISPECIES: outer membrane beta-barrel protein [Aequorivita]|uniref:outer membrane beta-barrel protein n=1 Tax=Aequorivita TaxID=153265 RepID=UPI0021AAF149|nr:MULTISPECIES: outer membrane beta-barrel protein [Aequorivita]
METALAQEEKSGIEQSVQESQLNMDAVFSRPSLSFEKVPVALGGYLEANTMHRIEEGITDGLSFQARRLTIFLAASISERIKFLTEIEFEDGGKEIAIEFAALDVAFHPMFNFRGGIVMNPIGAFNENHDGPKWEFVERPDVAVNMLAATQSNAGFGVYGKTYSGNWIFGYEAYLTNGFNSKIISNEEDKTYLPAYKDGDNLFEENFSGKAMFSGKLAIKNRKIGELGLSYMGGAYNKFEEDGLSVEDKARVNVFAIDWNTTIQTTNTYIVGEAAFVKVETPESYTPQYGNKQHGFFIDVVQAVYKNKIFEWEDATFNLAARFDYVDWNVGKFKETDTNIGDQLLAVTPGISFRPTPKTVFRINYRYQWQKDIINNPAERAATWYMGFSSYF